MLEILFFFNEILLEIVCCFSLTRAQRSFFFSTPKSNFTIHILWCMYILLIQHLSHRHVHIIALAFNLDKAFFHRWNVVCGLINRIFKFRGGSTVNNISSITFESLKKGIRHWVFNLRTRIFLKWVLIFLFFLYWRLHNNFFVNFYFFT